MTDVSSLGHSPNFFESLNLWKLVIVLIIITFCPCTSNFSKASCRHPITKHKSVNTSLQGAVTAAKDPHVISHTVSRNFAEDQVKSVCHLKLSSSNRIKSWTQSANPTIIIKQLDVSSTMMLPDVVSVKIVLMLTRQTSWDNLTKSFPQEQL